MTSGSVWSEPRSLQRSALKMHLKMGEFSGHLFQVAVPLDRVVLEQLLLQNSRNLLLARLADNVRQCWPDSMSGRTWSAEIKRLEVAVRSPPERTGRDGAGGARKREGFVRQVCLENKIIRTYCMRNSQDENHKKKIRERRLELFERDC